MSITSNAKESLMAHQKYTWGICLVLLIMFNGVVSAQVTTGIISGTIQDSSGAVVPHAMVNVRQTATALNRSTETDGEGRYRISELPLGEYEVVVSLSGFATQTQKGVTLTVGREAVVNVALNVGTAAESVSVTAEAPLVETTNASNPEWFHL
jgi:carboxypeptidase family protein